MVSPGCTVVPVLGIVVSVATGGRLPTVTLVVVDVLNAPGSVTVRVGVKVVTLGVTYWWMGPAPLPPIPGIRECAAFGIDRARARKGHHQGRIPCVGRHACLGHRRRVCRPTETNAPDLTRN